ELLVAERRARAALEAAFAAEAQLSEPSVARALAAALPREALLFVSSSMPVRDLDAWASAGEARVLANRGVNGIDGIVSSALGACIREALGNGLRIVEVRTERTAIVEKHRELQRIVAAALEAP